MARGTSQTADEIERIARALRKEVGRLYGIAKRARAAMKAAGVETLHVQGGGNASTAVEELTNYASNLDQCIRRAEHAADKKPAPKPKPGRGKGREGGEG